MRASTRQLCYLTQDSEESNNTFMAMNASIDSVWCHCQESWKINFYFYNGTKVGLSTVRNQQVRSVLQSLRLKIFSRVPVGACDSQPKVRTFQQNERYDGTRHLVDQLDLDKEQFSVNRVFLYRGRPSHRYESFLRNSCNQVRSFVSMINLK